MPSFLVLGIYFLLSGNGERTGWNRFRNNYGVSILTGLTTWRLLFPNDDIKAEMVSPPWNNFLRFFLHFIVVRSGHNEGLGRISFRSVFLILRWQKEKKKDTRKKKFLNSAYMNVSRHSLGIYSQAFCRVFACAVIHTAKCRTSLVLRS
jgi:hypothetical protein